MISMDLQARPGFPPRALEHMQIFKIPGEAGARVTRLSRPAMMNALTFRGHGFPVSASLLAFPLYSSRAKRSGRIPLFNYYLTLRGVSPSRPGRPATPPTPELHYARFISLSLSRPGGPWWSTPRRGRSEDPRPKA
jgi:hypothetical protein